MLKLNIDKRGVAQITLNRPEIHNAFNAELIQGLTDTLDRLIDADRPVRVLVLSGSGASFSAGADLSWMRSMSDASEMDNRSDASRLAAMFRTLDQLPIPTIARVNGSAFGGGVGLIACCDIAIADDRARFGLTEVRLGLIPATIAPFVIRRIGTSAARRLLLTGERFDSTTAQRIGLVSDSVLADQLDTTVEQIITALLAGGPQAIDQCKQLIRRITEFDGEPRKLDSMTAEWIARLRVSEEGQHGLRAFLNKRKPDWIDTAREN
ncbi:MAG: enoyl-CoA hydratase/isomerase family protein [Pseudomonadota bacterium]